MRLIIVCIGFVFLAGLTPDYSSAQNTTLTVNYVCTEINAGYDYEFKIKLYVDGSYIGESSPRISSSPNQATFTVPAGYHTVKIIGLKNYQGTWEESLKANNYSVDSKVEQAVNISDPTAMDIIFKMSSGTEVKSITSVTGSSAGGETQPQTPYKIR